MSEAALQTPPARLRDRQVAGTTRRAQLLGEEVVYRTLPGRGRPLVAIHGLGSDGLDLCDLCARVGRPTVLIDLPGFGASARPDRTYSVQRAARVALALLNTMGWVRPIWLGTSYGAHVALRAALDAPSRVERLVLISAGGLDPDPPEALRAHFQEDRLARRTRAELEATLAILPRRHTSATAAYAARRLRLHGAPVEPGQSDLRAVARSAQGALNDDAPRRLGEVYQRVDLFHGEGDPLVSFTVAEAAARRFAHGRIHPLSGLGHLPWLEAPAEVASLVRSALDTPLEGETHG